MLVLTVAAGYVYIILRQDGTLLNGNVPSILALLIGGALAAAAGGLLRSMRLRLGLLAACAVSMGLLGVMALWSIGLPLLLAAQVLVVAWILAIPGQKPRNIVRYSAAGAILGFGALAAVFAPSYFPSVRCLPGGAEVDSGWGAGGGGSAQGTMTGGLSGSTTGTFTAGDRAYTYMCHDGRLIEFRQVR
jgi:hypothetical protein